MKGYKPNLNVCKKTELSSKMKKGFIELGVKQVNKEEYECQCDKCKNNK